MSSEIPEAFVPLFRTSPYLDLIGPLYCTGNGAQLVIGFRVQEKHTNARGLLHGGVLASVADVALGYGLATSKTPPASMLTANLTLDYSGSAKLGEWVETSLDIQKLGSRLAFANAYFHVDAQRIARASAVFLVMESRQHS